MTDMIISGNLTTLSPGVIADSKIILCDPIRYHDLVRSSLIMVILTLLFNYFLYKRVRKFNPEMADTIYSWTSFISWVMAFAALGATYFIT